MSDLVERLQGLLNALIESSSGWQDTVLDAIARIEELEQERDNLKQESDRLRYEL